MRQAGDMMGISSSLVSQIENGRENIPKGEKLKRFLDCYGISISTFKKHVKDYKNDLSDREVVESLLGKVSRKDMLTLRVIVEHLVNNK